jgi:hypothetical protein
LWPVIQKVNTDVGRFLVEGNVKVSRDKTAKDMTEKGFGQKPIKVLNTKTYRQANSRLSSAFDIVFKGLVRVQNQSLSQTMSDLSDNWYSNSQIRILWTLF